LEIPAPFGIDLDALRARYAPATDDMAVHVTILPPIDIDADVMDAALEHLAAVARRTKPFRLHLQGSGTFRPVSRVVFVAVAEGSAACERLEREVRSGDLAVEARFPYHPHVTIAHDVPDADLDRALDELAGYSATMEIRSMALHENVEGGWRLVREFAFEG
jgi:2'-5' RNA ligase